MKIFDNTIMVDTLNFNGLSLDDNLLLSVGDVIFFNNSFIIITDYDNKNNCYGVNYLNDMNDHYIHNNNSHYEKIEFNHENLRKIIEYSNGYYDKIDVNSIKSWSDLYSFYFSI